MAGDGTSHLVAQGGERIYQAAGDQYFVEQPRPAAAAVRNTLPRDTATFAGRQHEIDAVCAAVDHAGRTGETIAVHAVDGMPGVGKSALAVHIGHLLAGYFPDGQQFLDLRAHAAHQAPVEPADALAGLLAADGVSPAKIPVGIDERVAMWRARMAGRRALLILDDAASHRQVEPLLPGAGGCLVLITSRHRLAALGARHGAAMLSLGTLPPDQAVELFGRLSGRAPTGTEPLAVGRLVQLCGYLPLAIALLAARLRPEPLWRVADLVAELAVAHDRFTHLQADDIAVAAAFDLSYRDLPPARRRFFRRLGLHPGVDLDVHAAAALDGVGVLVAQRHLDALYADHLIEQRARGRYAMHDLVADFARRLAARDTAADRDRAVARLLGYYQAAAERADRNLGPSGQEGTATGPPGRAGDGPPGGARDGPPRGAGEAMAWLRAELPNLLACAGHARRSSEHARVAALAAALAGYLRHNGPWQPAVDLHRAAVDAASHLDDRAGYAGALHSLGSQLRRVGDHNGAVTSLRCALQIYRASGDPTGEAETLGELIPLYQQMWRLADADAAAAAAIAIYRDLGDRRGEAGILTSLASSRGLVEDYLGAATALQAALTSFQALGDSLGAAKARFQLSVLRRITDDYPGATTACLAALDVYQRLGVLLGQANALHNLGVIRLLTGDLAGAARSLGQALSWYDDLGDTLGQANTITQLGVLRRAGGDPAGALALLDRAAATYARIGDRLGLAEVTQQLGITRWHAGDHPAAAAALHRAHQVYCQLGSRLRQAGVLSDLAALDLDRGDVATAEQRYRQAHALAAAVCSPREQARALEGAGRCAKRAGDAVRAASQTRQAWEIYQRIGAPDAARLADTATGQ